MRRLFGPSTVTEPVQCSIEADDLHLRIAVDDPFGTEIDEKSSRPGFPADVGLVELVHFLDRNVLDDLVDDVAAGEDEHDRIEPESNIWLPLPQTPPWTTSGYRTSVK